MATGARVCPHCGALNAADDASCYRCKQRLPGPVAGVARELFTTVLGHEYPMTKLFAILAGGVFLLGTVGKGEFPIWIGSSLRHSELVRWGVLVAHERIIGPLAFTEPWRHLAAVFVHFNAMHIVFNMMALASFGRVTEGSVGPGRFAVIFVVTGVLGFVASDFWYLLWYGFVPFTAGASGAVFGIIGAQAGEAWARRMPDWKARVSRAIGLAIVLALLFGLSGVNNAAHFGGLFTGIALGYAFGKERRPHRRDKLFNRIAAGLLVASLASVLACNWSPAWEAERQSEIQRELP
jgi:rhomboid protease GluP